MEREKRERDKGILRVREIESDILSSCRIAYAPKNQF